MKLLPTFSSSKLKFSLKKISLGSLVNTASVAQLSREATSVFSAVGKCKLPSKRHPSLSQSARCLTSLTQTLAFTSSGESSETCETIRERKWSLKQNTTLISDS